jgi:predicted metal-dependent hydrolase
MKQGINLKGKEISYELKKSSRARRMRVSIYCDGTCLVTVPHRISFERAKEFIFENANWILSKLEIMKKISDDPLFLKSSREEYLKYRKDALNLAQEKVDHFNRIYDFRYNKISIKRQKTRWGSCSKKGNLNFNYKILLIPEKFSNYIIVHEICHLKEFNHSEKFWKLVEKSIPDYRKIVREMKKG